MRACGSHEKQWKDGRQHDAQEYLRSILEAMQVLPPFLPPPLPPFPRPPLSTLQHLFLTDCTLGVTHAVLL